jgi:hypothetical protein
VGLVLAELLNNENTLRGIIVTANSQAMNSGEKMFSKLAAVVLSP